VSYQGVVAEQTLAAAGQLAGEYRDIGVLAVTSADRLNAGWTAAQQARTDGHKNAASHIEKLLENVPRHALMLTVIDGHPATLSWLGGVKGMPTISHGVEHFGQTGTIGDLYRHFRLDTASLVEAVQNNSARNAR
jgi:pyruvate dehydrogenase E1 component